jgi:mono/diheme cytochrome c family protein
MSRRRICVAVLAVAAAGLFTCSLFAEDQSQESIALFENQVRPVLAENCWKCHGPQKSESGLRLDERARVLKGGDSGPALVPGDPGKSLIVKAIRHEDGLAMPPKARLDARQVAAIEQWIKEGAAWPERKKAAGTAPAIRSGPITDQERAFWSLQPLTDPPPPAVDASVPLGNDIDRFVHARLSQDGLAMRPPADKRSLLRRATFDLTGLPPTPAEIESFLADDSPQAFAKVVDRLLGSPAYGERWGRHWLDVVRYADTAGETADYPTPLAYKYRNWVIRALNADMPYDEFVRQQIAGDLLGREMVEQKGNSLSPELLARYRDMVTATGFVAISRRFGFDVENYHHLTIQDTIDTLGQAVLGLSLGCARCHDHKFDPVNMTDYYAWYGIFESTRYSFPGSEEKKKPYDLFPMLPPQIADERQARFEQQVAALDADVTKVEAERKALDEQVAAVLGTGGFCGFENEAIGQRPTKPYGSLGSATIAASSQSPFDNVFPAGTRGIAFPSDGENNAFGRPLEPAHTPATSPILYYNIDFRNLSIAPGGGGAFRFYLGRGPGNSAAVEMAASATTFLLKNGDQYEPVCELKMGTWYNLQVTLDLKNKTFSGTIAAAAGATRFEGKAFTAGWDGVIDNTFVDRYGPGSGATPAHEIDNLAIGTEPFLPTGKSLENPRSRADEIRQLSEKVAALGAQRRRLAELTARRDALRKAGPFSADDLCYGAIDRQQAADARIQLRGEKSKPGDVAPRRNLAILGGQELPTGAGSGRRQLADWLTRSASPLAARVMVNRIWQQHFGRGLVSTENDFGTRGQRPTHPELLDWLATRFIDSGWSIKAMHRLIMASATYQQGSGHDARAAELDPDARLLWRFNRRRLSAEEIRDAMLLVSGDLDPSMGGAHPFPPAESWNFTQHTPFYGVYPTSRRSVYLMQQRLKRHPFLGLFDGADANVSTARRELTTVPTQALYLMNNEFVHERSLSLARRWLDSAKPPAERISQLFVVTLGRPATADEIAEANQFVELYQSAAASEPREDIEKQRRQAAWSAFIRTLLTRNEFLFVD